MKNREIKFRAWSKKDKRMLPWNVRELNYFLELPEKYVLMQFTGRQDKHKRDLYEGDIVECNTYTEHGNSRKAIGEIFWNDSEACWSIYSEHSELGMGTKNGLFLAWCKNITLLGNKYEHPEMQEEY